MAENGILDYQGMNQAIYRGATSNIVVDTQSMSIEIGAGNTSHTSNLHFECNHDANVASIKLNSNVVTEFPRSKKLIKYPSVAMTQNDESATSGYVASANSEYHNDYAAFRAFNTKGPGYDYGATIGWEPANIVTFNSSGTWVGSTSSSENTTMTLDDGNTIYGEWLQIQLPTKIRLEYVNFLPLKNTSHAMAHRAPRAGYILGSNNGTNWTALKNWSGIVYDTWTAYYDKFYKFDIDKEVDNYQYFRFVWTETAGTSSLSEYASCQELEFWGVPEYDPEAHGTDVTIKSKANVPNTDWLEVYYDAKGLPTGAVTNPISGLGGTTINGTATNVTVSDGAFVFDGSSSYITGGTTSISGNHNHSFSCWLKPTSANSGYKCIGYLFYSGSNNTTTGLFLNNNRPVFLTWGNNLISNHTLAQNEWVHITAVYDGTGRTIYVNCKQIDSDTYSSYNINASATLLVGASSTAPGEVFGGSIANFRVFNRALTTDEIYQLYAYQREYFGHGDLSMTLKAGRLGIGTSEPRAALDVRGDIYGGCPVFFRVWKSTDTLQGVNPIIWNQITINKGGGYSTITGKFTAPVSGYYEFIYGGVSGRDDWSAEMHAHKNGGSRIAGASAYASGGDGHNQRQLMNTIILELKVGETFHLSQPGSGSSNQDMQGGTTYAYNFFSGKYLSN